MRAYAVRDRAGESAEPAVARLVGHHPNLRAGRSFASLREAEVVELHGHARAPLAEFRGAERLQARRLGEVLSQLGDLRAVEQPRRVTDRPAPERWSRGARVELIALDQELLQR